MLCLGAEIEDTWGLHCPLINQMIDRGRVLPAVSTIWHYHGGCLVGKVVDRNFRVIGIDAFRVVDGSIFTVSPGTNPQSPLLMLGRSVSFLLSECFSLFVGLLELTTYPVVPKGTISGLCCESASHLPVFPLLLLFLGFFFSFPLVNTIKSEPIRNW